MKEKLPDIKLNFNGKTNYKVLIAPLDWCLGHTTRIIPIIHQFLSAGCQVILAGNSKQRSLLLAEFPTLDFLHLPGYNVKYSQHHRFFVWKLLLQLPSLQSIIRKEQRWLNKIIDEYKIDLVISDNRYGLFNKKIHTVFITHQLRIRSPFGKMIDKAIQKLHYQLIEKFDECWVPDQLENGLGGELSHPEIKPNIPVSYTGWLSRFKQDLEIKKEKYLLIIFSGPEPQRTIFEDIVLEEINTIHMPVILVRGLPGEKKIPELAPGIIVYNHLPSVELNRLMLEASFIISRCGYSTVMDVARLKKRSILVPTPGQTEQEYLTGFLSSKHLVYCEKQSSFSLTKCLEQAKQFEYYFPTENADQLAILIAATINKLDLKIPAENTYLQKTSI